MAERWSAAKKAAVVAASVAGADDAMLCAMHDLSPEELAEWKRRHKKHGLEALKVKHTKRLR